MFGFVPTPCFILLLHVILSAYRITLQRIILSKVTTQGQAGPISIVELYEPRTHFVIKVSLVKKRFVGFLSFHSVCFLICSGRINYLSQNKHKYNT